MGIFLERNLSKQNSIYLGEIGFIPYKADLIAYDLHGLGTREIGKNGRSLGFLNDKQPDALILYNYSNNCMQDWEEGVGSRDIQSDALDYLSAGNFEALGSVVSAKGLCLAVFLRKYLVTSTVLTEFDQVSQISKANLNPQLRGLPDFIKTSYKYLIWGFGKPKPVSYF